MRGRIEDATLVRSKPAIEIGAIKRVPPLGSGTTPGLQHQEGLAESPGERKREVALEGLIPELRLPLRCVAPGQGHRIRPGRRAQVHSMACMSARR